MEDLSPSPLSTETEGVCIHPLKVTKFESCVWKYILREAWMIRGTKFALPEKTDSFFLFPGF